MEEQEITVQDVKQQLQRIQEKKSPGPDGMKPDIIKSWVQTNSANKF